jgi:hypothetical protein
MDAREATAELFSAPLDAFVETRTRLAAALIAAGQRAEGQTLKKVRKPSPSAWATNQVVRRARAELDAFLAASEHLRESQGAIVAGRGDRGVYQADVDELRGATTALAAATRRVLDEAGRGDDRALVDRVVANARAAALTEAARAQLLGGVLEADLDGGADAFGGLFAPGAPAAAGPPRPAAARPPVAAPAPGQAAREQEAQRREEARRRELDEATRDEAEARAAAASAETAAKRAREDLDGARRRLEDAERAVREASHALREAETAQRTAQREADEAGARAGRATRRREALEKK